MKVEIEREYIHVGIFFKAFWSYLDDNTSKRRHRRFSILETVFEEG